jgi:hypothetical protein
MSSVISFPQTRMITAIHLENVTEVAMEAFLRHTGATFWFGSVQDSGCYKVDDVVAHFYAGDCRSGHRGFLHPGGVRS